jgi:hypothetical protein
MNTTAEDLNYLANTNEYGSYVPETCKAAIAEIASLTEERDRLRNALAVFADGSNWFVTAPEDKGYGTEDWDWMHDEIRDPAEFARQALNYKPQDKPQ